MSSPPPTTSHPASTPSDDGSLSAYFAQARCAAGNAATSPFIDSAGEASARLCFEDGSVVVVPPHTTAFSVGSSTLPVFAQLPRDVRRHVAQCLTCRKRKTLSGTPGNVWIISSNTLGDPWGFVDHPL